MQRITFFRSKCIGCNACVEAAPERWRVSRKDGRCTLIGGKEKNGVFHAIISDDEKDINTMAAGNCPVKIIRIDTVK